MLELITEFLKSEEFKKQMKFMVETLVTKVVDKVIEEKKRKKVIKKAGDLPDGSASTPDFEDVSEYFLDAGCENRLASRFMNYYDGTGWMTKTGKPITNWKAFADMWIDRDQEKQQYSEPEFNRL